MNKKEQIKYIEEVIGTLKEHSLNIGWLQNKINISRSHWYFLKKGDRPLTDERRGQIDTVIRQFLISTKYP